MTVGGPFSVNNALAFNLTTGPNNFGPGAPVSFGASSFTGNVMGVRQGAVGPIAIVPSSYVSGNPLSGTATFNNQTLATLGFTPGTYTFNASNGETFTVTSITHSGLR